MISERGTRVKLFLVGSKQDASPIRLAALFGEFYVGKLVSRRRSKRHIFILPASWKSVHLQMITLRYFLERLPQIYLSRLHQPALIVWKAPLAIIVWTVI